MDNTDDEQKQAVSEVVTAQAHYHKLKLVCGNLFVNKIHAVLHSWKFWGLWAQRSQACMT